MTRRRKRKRKPMKIIQWFKSLSTKQKVLLISGIVLVSLIATVIIYVASIFGKLNTQKIDKEDIHVNELDETVGVGYTNFVLFGGDSRSGEVEKNLNTDTIIVVSLNNETKEVKLVSVYRDTLLDVTTGAIKKCNSAYAGGGATRAINMLNMNLDLDIQKYVTVDFGAVSELIDLIGGVEIDVSEKERLAVNNYIEETAMVAHKKANKLTKSGLQTLDGVQATTYARIRKGVGDDYARTERQRLIIQKVVEKCLKSDLGTINNIINKLFPRIATNFTMTEILSYAKGFTKYKVVETTGFPFDKGSGTIPKIGSSVFPITLKSNVTKLHEFLYGTVDYVPSSKVQSISEEIAEIVGNRKVDSPVQSDPSTNPPSTDPPSNDPPSTDPPSTDPPSTDPPGDEEPTEPEGDNNVGDEGDDDSGDSAGNENNGGDNAENNPENDNTNE